MNRRSLRLGPLICVFCVSLSCRPPHSSLLIDELLGGSTSEVVTRQLGTGRPRSSWSEKEALNPNDRRPRHDFIYMIGPYSDQGIPGRLELTFYNDRLMEAQFTPNDPERYFQRLSKSIRDWGSEPGKPRNISPEVTLTYYRDAGGGIRFIWTYLPISKEWDDWVARYSLLSYSHASHHA